MVQIAKENIDQANKIRDLENKLKIHVERLKEQQELYN